MYICAQLPYKAILSNSHSPVCNFLLFAVCPVLQNPQNGHVDYSNQQRTVGTTAYYSCNSSSLFMLSGDEERECQIDATWSGSAPICVLPSEYNTNFL